MDLAGGSAGMIGLAALTASSVKKIVDATKEVSSVDSGLRQRARLLNALLRLLRDIEQSCQVVWKVDVDVDVFVLNEALKVCLECVEEPVQAFDGRSTSLDSASGWTRRGLRLKAFSQSKEAEKRYRQIRDATSILDLALSELTRYGLLQVFASLALEQCNRKMQGKLLLT